MTSAVGRWTPRRPLAAVAPRFALLLLLFVLAPALAAAADPVQLIDVDTAPRVLAPGEETQFEWTVRNADTITYNVSVSFQAPEGWTAVLDPTAVTGLAPNRAAGVRLNIAAPPSVESAVTAEFRVVFTVTDGGATVSIASRNVTASIPSIYAEKRVLGLFGNPLPAPLDNEWGVFLLDVLLWLGIALVLLFVLDPVVKTFTLRTKTQLDDIILRIVKAPVVVLLFLFGAVDSLSSLDRHLPGWLIDGVGMIYGLGTTIVVFYLSYRLFKDVLMHLARNVAKRTASNIDDVLLPIVEKVGLIILAFAAIGLLLGYLQVDLTLFVAGGVVTSMVIAFAAQDTLSNFFAGIFLLSDRPFKEGDEVIISEDFMVVRRVGMRTTRFLRYSDASIVTLPNNKLVNERIVNFSNPKDPGRVMMTLGVAYGSNPEKVKQVIRGVVERCPNLVRGNPDFTPVVRFDAMADSSLNFFVLVWVDERKNRFAVQDFLNTEVYKALNEAGIEIPFPQRTVHLLLEGLEERAQKGEFPKEVGELADRLRKVMPAAQAAAPAPRAPKRAAGEVTEPTGEIRMSEPSLGASQQPVEPTETVGELFDRIVTKPATVPQGASLREAIEALLSVPNTRKVYVLDPKGKPVGAVTLESFMRHLSYRMGAREAGMFSFLRFVRELQSDRVEGAMREPVPVTRRTRLIDVARLVVEHKINDFPVVDEQGRLIGELNSLKLLEAVLAFFEPKNAQAEEKNAP